MNKNKNIYILWTKSTYDDMWGEGMKKWLEKDREHVHSHPFT